MAETTTGPTGNRNRLGMADAGTLVGRDAGANRCPVGGMRVAATGGHL